MSSSHYSRQKYLSRYRKLSAAISNTQFCSSNVDPFRSNQFPSSVSTILLKIINLPLENHFFCWQYLNAWSSFKIAPSAALMGEMTRSALLVLFQTHKLKGMPTILEKHSAGFGYLSASSSIPQRHDRYRVPYCGTHLWYTLRNVLLCVLLHINLSERQWVDFFACLPALLALLELSIIVFFFIELCSDSSLSSIWNVFDFLCVLRRFL